MSHAGTTSPADNQHRLREMLMGYRISQLLIAAAKLGIADLLRDGPLGLDELAVKTQSDKLSLYRLLRTLASVGLFREIDNQHFEHSELSQGLRSDVPGSLHRSAVFYGETWWWDAWGRMYDTVKTGRTALDQMQGASLFEFLDRHPQSARLFHDHMSNGTANIARSVAAHYDFSSVKTICDVGAGQGTLLQEILKTHSHLSGMLCDLPDVMEAASKAMQQAALLDRVSFHGGSFFDSIPSGADLYIFKSIIHDWWDEQSIQILRNCRQAMPANGKLLLIEFVIPPANQPSTGKLWDMSMLVIANGIERTEHEYRQLLTSSGFELQRVIGLPIEINIIEAVPV